MATFEPWKTPLRGVEVLDLSRMLPGATATLLLADLGATVHKVEHVDGDDMRRLEPSVGDDSSAQHRYVDRGKHSLRVDLKTEEGLAVVHDLARGSDVVIESFRPGVADRIGVGYERLRQLRPELVYLSLTGYGQSGPRAQHAGHDLNFLAYAGLQEETVGAVQHADVAGGMLSAVALLAGVVHARATGEGAHIDLSLADAALFFGGFQLAERLASAVLDQPIATPLDGRYPCYRVYRAADGRSVAVGAIEPKFWARVVERLDRPDWLARQHDPALIEELAALIGSRPATHWQPLLEGPDTCVTVVRDAPALLRDEHVAHRGSVSLLHTVAGALPQVEAPIRARSAAPR